MVWFPYCLPTAVQNTTGKCGLWWFSISTTKSIHPKEDDSGHIPDSGPHCKISHLHLASQPAVTHFSVHPVKYLLLNFQPNWKAANRVELSKTFLATEALENKLIRCSLFLPWQVAAHSASSWQPPLFIRYKLVRFEWRRDKWHRSFITKAISCPRYDCSESLRGLLVTAEWDINQWSYWHPLALL